MTSDRLRTSGAKRWFACCVVLASYAIQACDSSPSAPDEHVSIFELLTGTWVGPEPGTCDDNPHSISFDAARTSMVLTYRRPFDGPLGFAGVFRYDILDVADRNLRAAIVDPPETRRTSAGDLVVWDLVVVTQDVYRWHRTDWAPGLSTSDVRRCAGS